MLDSLYYNGEHTDSILEYDLTANSIIEQKDELFSLIKSELTKIIN